MGHGFRIEWMNVISVRVVILAQAHDFDRLSAVVSQCCVKVVHIDAL